MITPRNGKHWSLKKFKEILGFTGEGVCVIDKEWTLPPMVLNIHDALNDQGARRFTFPIDVIKDLAEGVSEETMRIIVNVGRYHWVGDKEVERELLRKAKLELV